MSISEAVLTALFCMAVVFTVLILLWGIIRLSGGLIRWFEKKTTSFAQKNSMK